ncbi:MAG: ribosome-binding factor A, partial [Parcubacteria group bacterium]
AATSPDLRYATVYISVLPALRGPSTLASLKRRLPYIQHLLNQQLVLHHIPRLSLALDPGEQHARAIEKVLAQEKRFGPRWHGRGTRLPAKS